MKIKDLLIEMGFEYKVTELVSSFELNKILKEYVIKEKIDINSIPNGKGKRKTKSQRILHSAIHI